MRNIENTILLIFFLNYWNDISAKTTHYANTILYIFVFHEDHLFWRWIRKYQNIKYYSPLHFKMSSIQQLDAFKLEMNYQKSK